MYFSYSTILFATLRVLETAIVYSNVQDFLLFGVGGMAARTASSNTIFNPSCVRAEHSRYLLAPISFCICSPWREGDALKHCMHEFSSPKINDFPLAVRPLKLNCKWPRLEVSLSLLHIASRLQIAMHRHSYTNRRLISILVSITGKHGKSSYSC